MIEKVKEMIRKEVEGKGEYLQAIGNYVLVHIEINKTAAEKIAEGEKTVKECWERITSFAKTKAINGVACLTDEEVYKKVKEYFEFEAEQSKVIELSPAIKAEEAPKPRKRFSANLNDLLK